MISLDDAVKLAENDPINVSIGIQKEHTLHRVIKYLIDPSGINHEVKIAGKIADIYMNGTIYEVQTKAFNNLRDKLNVFLDKYEVVICYPLICTKTINRINCEGEIVSIRKSPKKGKEIDALVELYKIKQFLKDKNLKILIMLIDADEYQQVVNRSYNNHHGRLRVNQIPTRLIETIQLNSEEDYKKLLPKLPESFTSSDLCKALKVSKRNISYIIQVLKYVNAIEVIKKDGKKHIYHLVK